MLRFPTGSSLSPALVGTLAVLALMPRVSLPRTVLLATGTLIVAVLPIAVTIASGQIVGAIPAVLQDGIASLAGAYLVNLVVALGLLVTLARIVGPLQRALAYTFAREVDRHLQERVLKAVGLPSGISHLEDPAILDLVRNAQGVDLAGQYPGDAVRALASLTPSWLRALGSAILLVSFHWWLGVLWLALWPIMMTVLQREFIRLGQVAGEQAGGIRRSIYLRDLALRPSAAKELRIWGMLGWLFDRLDLTWLETMGPIWAARRPWRPVLWLSASIVTVANLVAFVALAWAGVRGDVGLAALAVYARAILDAGTFRAFDDPNANLANAAVSVPSILELERKLAHPHPAASSSVSSIAVDAPRVGISFEGVEFRYPGRTVDVLSGLDLFIPAGQSLAVVGVNGSGKTTLIKLLCRLIDPSVGRILVDGVDLRQVDPASWLRQVSAIFQDFGQYPLSARDNLALGARGSPVTLENLRSAADKVGALALVESLPAGWDTVLSREYRGGVELSGGQWQRIALARAVVAVEAGARVLILDEPTASLDVRAEAALYDRFLDITAGLTTILISHRFSTVRRADYICVLSDGRIIERGTHDELRAAGGQYASMFNLQAERFEAEAIASGIGSES